MVVNIGWPEGIYILLNILSLIAAIGQGEIRATPGGALATWIIITLPLLYWGGFFA